MTLSHTNSCSTTILPAEHAFHPWLQKQLRPPSCSQSRLLYLSLTSLTVYHTTYLWVLVSCKYYDISSCTSSIWNTISHFHLRLNLQAFPLQIKPNQTLLPSSNKLFTVSICPCFAKKSHEQAQAFSSLEICYMHLQCIQHKYMHKLQWFSSQPKNSGQVTEITH